MKKYFTLLTFLVLSVGGYAQYCLPTYSTGPTVGDSIVNFQLESINASFPGSPSGYNNYTGLAITDLVAGGTYTATMLGNPNFGITAAVWIDYDNDTTFSAAEKLGEVAIATGQTGSITFTVPASAVIDTLRLRMVSSFSPAGPLTPCGSYTWGETEDYHVNMIPPPPDDAGISAIDSFAVGCGLSAAEVITVEVQNFGTNAQTTFPVSFSVNGNAPVTETYTGSLAASGGVDTFTFVGTVDLSLPATTYTIQVWSSLVGDGNVANDTLTYVVQTGPGAPYFEDFESFTAGSPGTFGPGWSSTSPSNFAGWFVETDGTANSTGTGPIDDNTPGGSVYLYTETSSGSAGDTYELFLPCVSLAGTTTPRLSFFYHMFGATMGTLSVKVVGGSATGQDTTIWTLSGQQQAAEGDPWLEAIVDLTPWAGGGIELMFEGIRGTSFTGDMAIDDINIYQPSGTDLAIIGVQPSGQVCLSTAESITVLARNLGATPLDFSVNPFTATVNVSNASTGSFTSPSINSGTLGVLDTIAVTVTNTADLSAAGIHVFDAYVAMTGDGDVSNDTTLAGVESLPSFTLPFDEDFESFLVGSPGTLANGWTRSAAGNFEGWLVEGDGIQNNTGTGPIDDHTPGGQVYMYLESSSGAQGQAYELLSPCIELLGTASPKVSFWYHMFGATTGTMNLIVRNGSSTGQDTVIWTLSGQQQTSESAPWQEAIADLTPWAGAKIQLVWQAVRGSSFTGDMAIDDVSVFQPVATDISTLSVSPSGAGCYGPSEEVTVLVRNDGANPIDFSVNPLTVTVDVTNASTQTLTSPVINTGTLGVLDSLEVTVSTTADFSNLGIHVFEVYSVMTGDLNAANDTIAGGAGIETLPVQTAPLFEDFETFTSGSPGTLANGWTRTGGSNFEGWMPEDDGVGNSTNTGPNDDNTPGGSVYMFTETSSGALGSRYELISPCLDLTGLPSPKLSFFYHMFGADMGTLEVEIREAGTTTTVWSLSGEQQIAESDPYEQAFIDLTPWAGASIQVVFVGIRGASFTSDMAIDDVNIFQPAPIDVAGIDLTDPAGGCGLGAAETICFDYFNAGGDTLTGVTAKYSINGGAFTTVENITGSLAPFDTANYCFTTPADFSAGGLFDVTIVVNHNPVDTVNSNDTIFAQVAAYPLVSTFPYIEDFESGEGGWIAGGVNSSWAFGTPNKNTIIGAASGVNAWTNGGIDLNFINNDPFSPQAGSYNENEQSFVVSPCFDFTTLDTPVVRMSIWWESAFSWDGAVLQSTTDGGATWENVGAFGDPNNWFNDNTINGNPGGQQEGWTGVGATSSGGWVQASNRMDSLGGEPNVQLRVAFGSGTIFTQEDGFAFDNVTISEFSPIDGAMSALLEPAGGCGLSDSSQITIEYTNSGTAPVTNYTIGYQLVGSPTIITETPGDTIQPGQVLSYTFSTTVDLSVPGNYQIKHWITATGDTDPANDTLNSNVVNKIPIATFPYFEDFENGGVLPTDWEQQSDDSGQDWFFQSGPTGSFGTGPAGDHTTGSGFYAYVEDSGFENDSVTLITPCFDVSALNSPKFSFWYHSNNNNQPNNENELHIDLIFNGSIIYDIIPPIAHKDNNWNQVEIDLSQYLGSISVRFRVNNNNSNFSHDIAIDDINIEDVIPQDAGITAVAEPVSGCGLSANDTLVLALANLGTDTIFGGFNVNYTLNGGPVVTTTFTDTLLPGFLVPVEFPGIDFSVPGDYEVVAWTSGVTGDTNLFNDSTTQIIKSIPQVATFPYVEDFESGDGGWTVEVPTGGISSFGFGTPNKLTIQGAASGVNAWATAIDSTYINNDGLPARYNDNEDGWVISPCFDFSNLAAPTVQMSVWWNSEFSWDGAVLQSTVDNGATWQNVGAFGDPDNWYTDNTINGNPGGQQEGWTGRDASGNGSGGWVTAKNRMDSLAGEPEVRLRVAFGSDGSVIDDGFAFDDVLIFDTPGDDVGVVSIDDPASFGCSDDSTLVQVTLTNFGLDTALNVPVLVDITGAGSVSLSATFPGPLAPGDSASFVVGTFNTNAGGIFNLAAYTAYVGDTLVFNDTTFSSTDVTVRPPAPTAVEDSVILCTPDSTMLMVLNDTNFAYVWYDTAFGGTPIAVDTNVFQTGVLSQDTSFWVEAVPGGGGPAIKVSEAELLGPDYVEIINGGNTPVDVSGWTVAIGEDGAAGINTVATTQWNLTGTMNPGDILWRDDNAGSGANYWGSNILWNGGQEGWVVILDAQNNVIDAMFFNYTDAQIQSFAPTINGTVIDITGQWTGPGIVSTGFQNLTRIGSSDNNDASDWFGTATANFGGKGTLNPNLTLPITGGGAGSGCPSDRIEIKVIVAPDVPVNLGPDGIECAGFVIDAFDASFTNYQWSTGATTSSITADTTGVYFVDVVNAFGCTGSDSIFLQINPSPTVNLGDDTTACGSITLDAGNPGATYVWSEPGQFGQTLDVTTSGQYFVTVDLQGCTSDDTVNVTIEPTPVVDLGSDLTSCDPVTLDAGNPGASYVWSTGETSQTINVVPPTTGSDTITVVVTNAAGCDEADEIVVSAGVAPVVDLGGDATACDSLVLDAGVANGSYLWSTGATTQAITVTSSGSYTVSVTAADGCEAADTANVTVEQKPVADFTISNTGFTYDFTNTSVGGTSFLWDFGDGSPTSTDENPTHTYQFTGVYDVTLIVTNDCGSDTIVIRTNNVSLDDELFGGLIQVFPNPTKGEFFVSAESLSAQELTVEVTDSRGRVVFNEVQENVFSGFVVRVDLTEQAEGVYLVKITDGDNTAYKRVIRE